MGGTVRNRDAESAQGQSGAGNHRLHRLDALDDYKVADDDPDVRNWKVLDKNGDEIGKVDELIVDKEAKKVRYLDVDVKDKYNDTQKDDLHLLVPVGAARLDEEDDQVKLERLVRDKLNEHPPYDGGRIDRKYEVEVREYYVGPAAGATAAGTRNTGMDDTYTRTTAANQSSTTRSPEAGTGDMAGKRMSSPGNRDLQSSNPAGNQFREEKMDSNRTKDFTTTPDRKKGMTEGATDAPTGTTSTGTADRNRSADTTSSPRTDRADISGRSGTTGNTSSAVPGTTNTAGTTGTTNENLPAEGTKKDVIAYDDDKDDSFYEHDHFDEDRFYGNRRKRK